MRFSLITRRRRALPDSIYEERILRVERALKVWLATAFFAGFALGAAIGRLIH